jgi:hypothetical protein
VCACALLHGELCIRAAVVCMQDCTGCVRVAATCMGRAALLHGHACMVASAAKCISMLHSCTQTQLQLVPSQIHEHKWLGAPLSPTTMHQVLEVPCIPAFTLNLTHVGRRHTSNTQSAAAAAAVEWPGGLPVFLESLVTPRRATHQGNACWGAACCTVM